MPTFTKTSARGWVYRWQDFQDYEVTEDTAGKITMTYSEDRAGQEFESERSPWQVTFRIKEGAIVRVNWLDENGENLAVLKGLDFDADYFRLLLSPEVDQPWQIYQMMISAGTTFEMVRQSRNDSGFDVSTGVGDDVVRAIGGEAYIKDNGGADRYIGDQHRDTVTYDEWFWRAPERVERGIRVDLREEFAIGPDGERDVLKNIDGVRGTFKRDVLLGNGEDNDFMGFYGRDLIDGRRGFDEVSYRNDESQGGFNGVTVNLNKGFAIDGWGKRDTLRSIEAAEGTDQGDRFIGHGRKDNEFWGRDGDDVFVLRGGDDWVEGGDGADTFVFRGQNFGFDGIDDFNPEDGDRIRIAGADSVDDLTIEVSEDGETTIFFNQSEIFLNNYGGEVEAYLLF